MTSPSRLFERLGAPLQNVQWSWGAIRADRKVFLRVWQDETRRWEDGKRFIRLVNHAAYAGVANNLGYNERLRHLEALRSGAEGYVVLCRAETIDARPRTIASFDERELIRLGELRTFDGDDWGEMAARVRVRDLEDR